MTDPRQQHARYGVLSSIHLPVSIHLQEIGVAQGIWERRHFVADYGKELAVFVG